MLPTAQKEGRAAQVLHAESAAMTMQHWSSALALWLPRLLKLYYIKPDALKPGH